ncbi:MAG: ATP-binding cassette domain-containing protein, partial [Armatimonadota bacterium]|nr:ATP-binding cassette domain-containing protein [Armatimonadota bacterium]
MLEVQDLWAGYDDVAVVRGVSLRVADGEAIAVLGPNGAGKTTLFRSLVGLVRPQKGSVRFEGRPL